MSIGRTELSVEQSCLATLTLLLAARQQWAGSRRYPRQCYLYATFSLWFLTLSACTLPADCAKSHPRWEKNYTSPYLSLHHTWPVCTPHRRSESSCKYLPNTRYSEVRDPKHSFPLAPNSSPTSFSFFLRIRTASYKEPSWVQRDLPPRYIQLSHKSIHNWYESKNAHCL